MTARKRSDTSRQSQHGAREEIAPFYRKAPTAMPSPRNDDEAKAPTRGMRNQAVLKTAPLEEPGEPTEVDGLDPHRQKWEVGQEKGKAR